MRRTCFRVPDRLVERTPKRCTEMSITRAAAARLARQAEIESRHPQAVQYFKEGVGSVLRQWTALELAIHHQWGGPQSAERAQELVAEILELFLGPDKVYKDDIALLLEDYLDTNFCTICEDGSPDELGDLFCSMWRECIVGNTNLVTNALSREYVRHEMVSKSEGLDGGDADDGSDEEYGNEAEDAVNEAVREQLGAVVEGDMETEDAEAPPLVAVEPTPERAKDPDGWETVERGKKTKKR
jgi:pre-rRNA-processing protein TSR2